MFIYLQTCGLSTYKLAVYLITNLRFYCDSMGASVYHYRDQLDREADAVIQFADGSWALVEVKLGDAEEINKAS